MASASPASPTIRRARHDDAQGIHEAHMRSIQELCAGDYTPEQIKVWGHRPFREAIRLRNILEDWVWVVEVQGKIEGFAHFKTWEREEGKIGVVVAFYFTPKVKGQGLGRQIFELIEEEARSLGIQRIELESSLTSRRFYSAMGFSEVNPHHAILLEGVSLPCVVMEKRL